jgi:hypothetical protein
MRRFTGGNIMPASDADEFFGFSLDSKKGFAPNVSSVRVDFSDVTKAIALEAKSICELRIGESKRTLDAFLDAQILKTKGFTDKEIERFQSVVNVEHAALRERIACEVKAEILQLLDDKRFIEQVVSAVSACLEARGVKVTADVKKPWYKWW